MTERNENILRLLSNGKTYSQIAVQMGLTRSVVAGVIYRSSKEPVQSLGGNRRSCCVGGRRFTTLKEAAYANGVTDGTIRRWIGFGYKGSAFLDGQERDWGSGK